MKKPYQLRLDEEMIVEVQKLAEKNMRSVNSEFRQLIKKSLIENVICGVYKITNPDGFFYIGSSKNIEKRFLQHLTDGNVTSSVKLSKSFNMFGSESHIFEILEECKENELKAKEFDFIRRSDHRYILNVVGIKTTSNQTIYTEEELNKMYICDLNNTSKLTQIDLSDESEMILTKLSTLSWTNNLKLKSKKDLIELSLKLVNKAIDFADDETFENLFNLKK
ncbi:MAG: catalytic domain [Bacteroidota bacterium]|jgi:group I intron endonuclease